MSGAQNCQNKHSPHGLEMSPTNKRRTSYSNWNSQSSIQDNVLYPTLLAFALIFRKIDKAFCCGSEGARLGFHSAQTSCHTVHISNTKAQTGAFRSMQPPRSLVCLSCLVGSLLVLQVVLRTSPMPRDSQCCSRASLHSVGLARWAHCIIAPWSISTVADVFPQDQPRQGARRGS